MNNKIQVTVCCLAYNHEKYIRKALEGFVMQKTNFDYEVIVHDDASTDKTADIIREFAEKYPQIIKPIFQVDNQYSRGIRILAKHVLPRAKGRYIAFCEGDDYWTDANKLQKQFNALESHPECSLSVHKVTCCNEDGSQNSRSIPIYGIGLDRDTILTRQLFAKYIWQIGGYNFHTSSYFLRREVLDIPIDLERDEGILRKCLIAGAVFYFCGAMSMRRLWSIGNFNSRLKIRGFEGLMWLSKRNMDIDIRFNNFTNGIYKDLILPNLFGQILFWAWYAPENARKAIIDNNLLIRKVWKYLNNYQRVRALIKYPLLWSCPFALKYLYQVGRFRIKLSYFICKIRNRNRDRS